MDYGRAWVTMDGETEVTLVVFGPDDAPALLGAYTLKGLALAVDPVEQRLVPTHLIMYSLIGRRSEGSGPESDRRDRRAVGEAIAEGCRRFPQTDDEIAWSEQATAAMIAEEPW